MRLLEITCQPCLQVRAEASSYWWLRAALAPFTLLNMALSGILQVHHLQPISQLGPVHPDGLPALRMLHGYPGNSAGSHLWAAACSGVQARGCQRGPEHGPVHCRALRQLCCAGAGAGPLCRPHGQPWGCFPGFSNPGHHTWCKTFTCSLVWMLLLQGDSVDRSSSSTSMPYSQDFGRFQHDM